MSTAPLPPDEDSRLSCLRALGALDMGRDHWLDSLAHRALTLFPGTASAAVSLIASDRQLFKGRASLDLVQTPRSHSFCAHAILQDGVLIVEDATQDERFADNPLVTGPPGIRFYAGAPLKDKVGTLCVIGLEPRRATQAELDALTALAIAVGQRLALHSAIKALASRIPLN
jgi:GAF domain-containing protein